MMKVSDKGLALTKDVEGLKSFPPLDVSSGTNVQSPWFSCTGLTTFPLLDVNLVDLAIDSVFPDDSNNQIHNFAGV